MNTSFIKDMIEINVNDIVFNHHIRIKRAIAIALTLIQILSLITTFVCGIIFINTNEALLIAISRICITINFTCLALAIITNIIEDIIWKNIKKSIKDSLTLDILFNEEE